MKEKDIKYMKYEDVPESWRDRCSGDGYDTIINDEGDRVYADNGMPVDVGYRPCAKCGEYPINDGEDYCLQHLGNVMNACCGHGNKKGYIQFDNGIIIEGYFEVHRFNVD